MKISPVKGVYDKTIDRESAYELLEKKAINAAETAGKPEKNKAKKKPATKRKPARRKTSTFSKIDKGTRVINRIIRMPGVKTAARSIMGILMRR